MRISKNSLIQWIGEDARLERVLHIDFDRNWASMYPIPVNSKKAIGMPYDTEAQILKDSIENGAAQIVPEDPYSLSPSNDNIDGNDTGTPVPRLLWKEAELSKEHRTKRDEVWEVLGQYVQGLKILNREKRGKIVDRIIEKHEWTKPVIYKYLHRWWQTGQVKNAFLPLFDRCGGKGKTRLRSDKEERKGKCVKRGRPSDLSKATKEATGPNMTIEMRDKVLRGLRKIFAKHKGISFAEAFRKLTEQYFNAGSYRLQSRVLVPMLLPPAERPTKGQARYWYNHNDRWLTDLPKRKGQRIVNLKYRGMIGSPTKQAFGPGSCFQIDSTVADIYLVSQLNRGHIIGRPIIYVVIDVFSRLIVGFYIGLRPASWRGAIAALRNAAEDKTEYCKSIGLSMPMTEKEWPCHFLPESICADRGKEYLSYASDDLVNGLNIRMDNTASYRADWKGLVERQFKLMDERGLHWAPGAVREERKLMGVDYRLDAKLNLLECRQLFAHLFYQHNNVHPIKNYPYDEFMIEDNVPPYPVDLWHWGIRNRSHVREVSPGIMANLLPSAEARVTASGIIVHGLSYSCPAAIKGRWFDKARVKGSSAIRVNFNEENTNTVFARLPNGRLERCYLLERHSAFADRHWDDVLDYFEFKKQDSERARPKREQRLAESRAAFDDIIAKATGETAKAQVNESRSARTKGIRENRIAEERLDRKRPRAKEEESGADTEHIDDPDLSDVIAKAFRRK
jgi:putative transposase